MLSKGLTGILHDKLLYCRCKTSTKTEGRLEKTGDMNDKKLYELPLDITKKSCRITKAKQ